MDKKIEEWINLRAKQNYEGLFKELYKNKEEKKEEIYSLLSESPKVMKYLTMEEKADIAEIILASSNSAIKNLSNKISKLNLELISSG